MSGRQPWEPLPARFFRRPAEQVAAALLGRYLVREIDGRRRAVRIVETEAYLGARDRASHAWNGRRTRRNASLYLPPGHAYVYFVYGLHHCVNVVTGDAAEQGGAVLLRAGEPIAGEQEMLAARGLEATVRPGQIAGGPARLCQALAIDRTLDGLPLTPPTLYLTQGQAVSAEAIATGPRIGIAYAKEAAPWPLRFAIHDNPHVSRPFPRQAPDRQRRS